MRADRDRQTDIHTDMTKVIAAFHKFVSTPKKREVHDVLWTPSYGNILVIHVIDRHCKAGRSLWTYVAEFRAINILSRTSASVSRTLSVCNILQEQ
jgi:hypothetical protein